MNKEFIPYEQALALKELGFNEPCFATYEFRKLFIGEFQNSLSFELCEKTEVFPAPTFSQAFRWFREKHSLQGYIYSTTVRGGKDGKHFSDYCWNINGIDRPFMKTDARDIEKVTYEEAELACLIKLIEIVKKKKP